MLEKVRSDHIKRALSKRHGDELFLTEVKTGSSTLSKVLIFDALSVKKSWVNPCITGYEIKVSRADFMQDQKWPGYLPYCHKFSFACPTGLIQPEELDDNVGLVYYNPENGSLFTKRKSKHRMIEMSADLIYYLLISRTETSLHPFFNSRREYFERMLEDESEKRKLGHYVAQKTGQHIKDTNERCEKLERENKRLEMRTERFDEIMDVLKKCGISTTYGWQDRLTERLKTGASADLKNEVLKLKQAVDRVAEIVS
jgi:hypothetical protein